MGGKKDSKFAERTEQISKISDLLKPVRSSEGSPWEGVAVEVFRMDGPTSVSAVSFDDLYVAVIREGGGIAWAEGAPGGRSFSAGDVGIFPRGVAHGASSNGAIAATSIYLKPLLIEKTAADLVNPDRVEIVPQLVVADEQIERLSRALEWELQDGFKSGRLLGESLGTALAAHLLARYAVRPMRTREYRGGMPKYLLRRTIDYMQSNLGADLHLTELAANVRMSLWHFSRMFKQSTGLSPHQYLMRERIEAAKRLLVKPHTSLEKIARELGFSDQSHLITVFRRFTGLTPKQYVKRIR